MTTNAQSKTKSGLAGLIKLISLHKRKMILSALFSILGEGFGIVPFVLIYFIVTEIVNKQSGEIHDRFIWTLVFFGIGAVLLKYIFLGISTLLSHISAYNILYDLRIKISKKLATLPLGYFNSTTSGRIKKVMLEDVEQMEIFIGHNIPDFVGALVYIIMTTTVLFVFDWRLALANISVLPIGIFAQSSTIKKNKDLMKKYYTADENMNATMIQYIQGMPIIKAFNHTLESFNKYTQSVQDCRYYADEHIKQWFLPMTIFTIAVSANLLVLLPVGAMMYLANNITLSTFVLFLLMGLGFGSPLFKLMSLGRLMGMNIEGQLRIDAILTAEPLREPIMEKSLNGKGVIARDVEFSYGDTKVLQGVNFKIEQGKFMAMVGPSGAGKTTLARLIPRFWDVDSGSISLGNTDIKDIKITTLMDEITFVFQDIFLFNDSVNENLKIGKPDADQSEIEAAAKRAQCHDFIMSLPNGYQSIIGEKGSNLSGGEKQRLSIARALLKNAPVIILDEATAFVDPENEVTIQKAINELTRDKTLIIIAHRLSTISGAEKIIVLDKGKISRIGTHSELLKTSILYKNMWEAHMSAQCWQVST